ncbi:MULTISPECIES: host cell division inhibitor Icd-like protein [Lelliottia]|uniref:Ash-like/host cell division inhibitor Icd-like protein n=1 Tax=Lelliottia aquatilis TaxID=2080838 RepID=A0ABX4ZXP8_9ENTR|nr:MULTISPECIES: host cell division inhibitor Icd-like protein [Lelliottia]NTZ46382.1 host cell division inhibitor Icd-like protein [Lelliottia aquatilis]POZ19815.1 Ash-like/host cell division inhibitor Icd-like protein [Lelliottia aquatilis]POZ21001.1 Ash-like/host cell division inhibitor Icd-like protein [Lelliottia aquatilis]POZ24438.1 Ash-like/host cell division inhibitor Icd-like protein [Lelliottia sp. 7254-16]POZ30687.1 Ash-like/host cell division inhibitor Icd-like protein [Lelliottia 
MMMAVLLKAPFSGLLPFAVSRYSFPAVAKSIAGICSPCNLLATQHAPSVFFYVVAQTHLFFGLWCFHRCSCQIMVVRAGQPSGWPVSNKAGTANPVRATTHEICSSGGGDNRYLLEVALMATILTPSHPQFVFVFAAVRRADRKPRICMLRIVAGDEHAARLSLVRDYVLSFAGRLPVAEVHA